MTSLWSEQCLTHCLLNHACWLGLLNSWFEVATELVWRKEQQTGDVTHHGTAPFLLSLNHAGWLGLLTRWCKDRTADWQWHQSEVTLQWYTLCLLTPSLPQPVQFLGWKLYRHACKQYIFQSCNVYFQCYAFWCAFHTPVWKRRQKGWRVSDFALLLVAFKWHPGSEGVNHVGWLWVLKSWFEGKNSILQCHSEPTSKHTHWHSSQNVVA